MSIKVTVEDLETGDTDDAIIGDGPGGYVIITGPGCRISGETKYQNGTVQITIKPT